MTDASVVLLSSGIAALVGLVPTLIKARADAVATRNRSKIEAEDREERRRVARRVEAVAVAAEEVKTALVETTAAQTVKLQQIGEVVAASHALANSGEDARLAKEAKESMARAVASGNPADITAAELAQRALAGHRAKQVIADTQGGQSQATGAASIKESSLALATIPPKEQAP